MSDLVERLLAAISELENAASEVKYGGEWWSTRHNEMPLVMADVAAVDDEGELREYVATDVERSTAVHIALHDPETVLRRCAADRRLLELHRQVPADVSGHERSEPTGCQICGKALLCDWIEGNGVCDTVLALAEGYALVERIERLEGDLRDTHDLAERVATARCSPGRCGPMDELDDQTYSLDRALTDVLKAKTTPEQARAAAEWIRRHIGSLETKVGHLEHLLTARMRNESQPAPDSFQRCDVSVPKQCVLQLGHGGHSHVSNSGTMWPTDGRRTLLPMPTSEPGDEP